MTVDQQIVDHLYSSIFSQWRRYNYFDKSGSSKPTTSVWNKSADERRILDAFIEHYKKFYVTRAEALLVTLETDKDAALASYLTYDPTSYIAQFASDSVELDSYIKMVNAVTIDDVCTKDLTSISESIDYTYPAYMTAPTLLGKLHLL